MRKCRVGCCHFPKLRSFIQGQKIIFSKKKKLIFKKKYNNYSVDFKIISSLLKTTQTTQTCAEEIRKGIGHVASDSGPVARFIGPAEAVHGCGYAGRILMAGLSQINKPSRVSTTLSHGPHTNATKHPCIRAYTHPTRYIQPQLIHYTRVSKKKSFAFFQKTLHTPKISLQILEMV